MSFSVFIHLQKHAQRCESVSDVTSVNKDRGNKNSAPFSSFTLFYVLRKSPLLSSEFVF